MSQVSETTMIPDGYRQRVVDAEIEQGLLAAGFVVLEGSCACGKTWTGLRYARSAVRLDTDVDARAVTAVEPAVLLRSPTTRLLDEWQVMPSLRKHVRHACDAAPERGLFIVAVSAQPADDITRHTGAGRIRRIRLRPRSLFESSDSSGEVSLSSLIDGMTCSAAPCRSVRAMSPT